MFSASDAAFSGFRAGREHARAALIWMVVFGLTSLAMFLAVLTKLWPVVTDLMARGPGAQLSEAQALEISGQFWVAVAPVIVPSLLLNAVQSAAVNRMMLRPQDSAFGYIRLGMDEVRQLAVLLLLGLVSAALNLLGNVALDGLQAGGAAISPVLGGALGFAGFVLVTCFTIFVSVRLSLAKAQTFATGRISLLGSWRMTRGHVWPMLGAYVLAIVLAAIVWVAVLSIAMLAAALLAGGAGPVQPANAGGLTALLTPPMIIFLMFAVIASPFLSMILLCPAPEIYRRLTAVAR
jgi:hypothetical protein